MNKTSLSLKSLHCSRKRQISTLHDVLGGCSAKKKEAAAESEGESGVVRSYGRSQ